MSFSYPSRPAAPVLTSLSLTIPAGRTTALVGASGSGKSTVIQLLQRFYDPDSGSVTVDQVNMKDLSLDWLRRQTGVVGQEPVLFDCRYNCTSFLYFAALYCSVRENIRLARPEASDDEITKACRCCTAVMCCISIHCALQ